MQEKSYNSETIISAKTARDRYESVTYPALVGELKEMRLAINKLVHTSTKKPYCTNCQLPKMSKECMTALKYELMAAGYKVHQEPFSWSDGSAVYRLDWSR